MAIESRYTRNKNYTIDHGSRLDQLERNLANLRERHGKMSSDGPFASIKKDVWADILSIEQIITEIKNELKK